MTFLASLRATKLLGILRGIELDELSTLAAACRVAKLKFLEITMNTAGATEKIRQLVELSGGEFVVGAGTVLDIEQYEQAIAAGATFIVSPVLVADVAARARRDAIPYIPGALSPQEVYASSHAGAEIVKLFPVQCFGPSYIRELRGPFPNIPLLACGGIHSNNLRDYLEAGADAAALGASTFKREWLRDKNRDKLSETLAALVAIAMESGPTAR